MTGRCAKCQCRISVSLSLSLSTQPATVTCTPGAVASTWSCTSCQAGEAVASVSTVVTTQRDAIATTARRVTTETWPSPSLTGEPAKVTGHDRGWMYYWHYLSVHSHQSSHCVPFLVNKQIGIRFNTTKVGVWYSHFYQESKYKYEYCTILRYLFWTWVFPFRATLYFYVTTFIWTAY